MLRLKIEPPYRPPFLVEIQQPRVTFGRSPNSDICLEDQFASRTHAELRVDGDTCWITDFDSANGTFLEGRRLQGTARLQPGNQIQIGSTTIVFQPPSRLTSTGELTSAGGRPGSHTGDDSDGPFRPQTLISRRGTGSGTHQTRITSVIQALHQVSPQPQVDRPEQTQMLAVMSKVGIALLTSSSLDEVLQQLTELIFEGIPADRAFFLLREDDGHLVCKAASYRDEDADSTPADTEVRLSSSIRELVMGQGQSVLTSDAQDDDRFRDRESIVLSGVRSVMAVPLAVNGDQLGMIYVDSPMNVNVFTDDDLHLLTTIASVAAIRVENALLLEQRIENERIKEQLYKAYNIQTRLLPTRPPRVPGYRLSGTSMPCFEVGGDYFDFIPQPNGRLLLALGDVSGKGMDAAILMSSLHAAIRVQADTGMPLGELTNRVNRYLCQTIPMNRFITAFLGQLNPETHQLIYTNSGHNPALLARATGEVEWLQPGGAPLGICDDVSSIPERKLHIHAGDVLVIYSDGLTESVDADDREFGEERLADLVCQNRQLEPKELHKLIDDALTDFLCQEPYLDDVTLVVLKRLR